MLSPSESVVTGGGSTFFLTGGGVRGGGALARLARLEMNGVSAGGRGAGLGARAWFLGESRGWKDAREAPPVEREWG